jgi:hypothetical protein
MIRSNRWFSGGLLAAALLAGGGAAHAAPSCAVSVGPERASIYVDRCLRVSPATHPPCNASNPCALILDEIRRGCALLPGHAPAFCRETPGTE